MQPFPDVERGVSEDVCVILHICVLVGDLPISSDSCGKDLSVSLEI